MAEPEVTPPAAPPPIDPNSEVKAFSPSGEKVTILAKDAAQLTAAGGRVATARDIQQSQLDAIPTAAKVAHVAMGDPGFWLQGGFTPEGETFSKGVASGATMGLSDLAAKEAGRAYGGDKLAQQYRDTSNVYDAESPLAAKLGEGVGMVAGTIAGGAMGGGGLGLGRGAAFLPSAGIGALGSATENAMARLTAGMLARGALGRAGSTALQWAARGAVEGALMEGMHQTTDDLFQDHDLAAQKIAMASGKGFLTGGAIGGMLGGAGSLAKSAVGGLSALRGVSGSIAERTEGQLARSLGEAESTAARAEANSAEALAEATRARNAAAANGAMERVERTAGETVSSGERKASSSMMADMAHGQAADSLGANQRLVAEAAESLRVNPDQARKTVGKFMLDNGLIKAGDTSADALVAAQGFKSRTGELIGQVFKDRPNATIHMDDVYNDGKAVADALRKQDNFQAAEKVEQYVANMERGAMFRGEITNTKMEHTLENFVEARRRLSKQAYEIGRTDPALERALKDLDRRFEGRITQKIEEAGKAAGTPELKATYESLKKDYQMARIVEDWAEHGTKAASANRKFSLTDTIMTVGGLAAAGPAGGSLGLANMVARGRGNSTAAILLDRMSRRGAAEAALHTFDDTASRAASGLLKTVGKEAEATGISAGNAARNAERGYAAAAKAAAKKAPAEADNVISRARTAMDEVKSANDNAVLKARIDQRTGDLRQSAPKLAGAMANTMTRAAAFLASKMPVETKPYTTLGAPDQKPTIDAVQAAKFLRYKEAVDNPQGCLDRFSRGEVRREDCETLKAVAPLAFQQIQIRTQRKLDEARDAGKPIPYEQRLKLSIVLDIQGDASLAPGMIRVMQRNLTTPQDGGSTGPKPSAPRRPMTAIGTQLQGTDKLESS